MAKINIFKFRNIFIIFFILVFIFNVKLSNSFAEVTYGEYFYEIQKPSSSINSIISTDGKFILQLDDYLQDAYVINDLKTGKPRLFLKITKGYYRNFDKNIEKTKYYNPIYKLEEPNLIENIDNIWWKHYKEQYTENIKITKNKYEIFDINGNKLFKEFYYEGDYSLDKIIVFDDNIFYVVEENDEEVMYLYNINTKMNKKIGNYRTLDLYEDKIILYSARDFYNGVETADIQNISFYDLNMNQIKTFEGYSKIDYTKINNEEYYVLTYNKRVKNKNNDEVIRFANFLDKYLNIVFNKDIFVDYERIDYDFDYKKVFNDNKLKNENIIIGPHDNLLNMKNVELIIELDDENLYIVSDKKGFYICDKDNIIIGDVFDKHIYLCNYASERDKLIFSYRTDEISYFKDYWNNDKMRDYYNLSEESFLYIDNEDINSDDILKVNIIYDFFCINQNKFVFLPKIDDMVIVPLRFDGLYAYYEISGNGGYKYIKKSKSDNYKNFKHKIFDLDGNIVTDKVPVYYQANLYKIEDKYFIDDHDGMSYTVEDNLYDFEGNALLGFEKDGIDETSYHELDNYLVVGCREYIDKKGKNVLKIYDKDFNLIKEIKDIKYTQIRIKSDENYVYRDYNGDYNRDMGWGFDVYDKDFNFVKEIKSINEIKGINKTKHINGDRDLVIYKTERKVEMPIDWRKRYTFFVNDKRNRYSLYDQEKKEYLFKDYKYLDVYNEKYLIYQYGFKYGLMDLEGNRLCELSIFDGVTDDEDLFDYSYY